MFGSSPVRILPFFAIGLGLSAHCVWAGNAFFSAEAKSVTFTPRIGIGFLYRLDVASGAVEKVLLKAPGADSSVIALCRGGDGETLLATDKGVFVHDTKGTRKISELPVTTDYGIDGIAAAPAGMAGVGDWLFLSGQDPEDQTRRILFARKPGGNGFRPIFCRRVNRVGDPVLTPDGRLFFSEGGDVWEGGIEPSEDGDSPIEGTLLGIRVAPLGFLNTDGSNGGSMWVNEIMPAGKSIYVRLAGHHISELVRVPLMAPIDPSKELSTIDLYRRQAEVLAKAESIPVEVDQIQIAAATDVGGEKVFYRGSHDGTKGLFIWEKTTGKTRKVGVEPDDEP